MSQHEEYSPGGFDGDLESAVSEAVKDAADQLSLSDEYSDPTEKVVHKKPEKHKSENADNSADKESANESDDDTTKLQDSDLLQQLVNSTVAMMYSDEEAEKQAQPGSNAQNSSAKHILQAKDLQHSHDDLEPAFSDSTDDPSLERGPVIGLQAHEISNKPETETDQDHHNLALNKAIEDALRTNFPGVKHESHRSEPSELRAAEINLSREIENALEDTEILEKHSGSVASSEESTDYSPKGKGGDPQEVNYGELKAGGNATGNGGEMAELELTKAIEEALKIDIAGGSKSSAEKDSANQEENGLKRSAQNEVSEDPRVLASSADLSRAIADALKDARSELQEKEDEAREGHEEERDDDDDDDDGDDDGEEENVDDDDDDDDDDEEGSQGNEEEEVSSAAIETATADDPALQEALAQVAQNVVETNLFATKQQKISKDKDNNEMKTGGDSSKPREPESEEQWSRIMEKALEMAAENSDALLSNLNVATSLQNEEKAGPSVRQASNSSSDGHTLRSPVLTSESHNGLGSVSALAHSMVNAAISTAAMKVSAQQRLTELTGQPAGANVLSAYQQYLAASRGNFSPSVTKPSLEDKDAKRVSNKELSSEVRIHSYTDLIGKLHGPSTQASAATGGPITFVKPGSVELKMMEDRREHMSIAETLALERQKMGSSKIDSSPKDRRRSVTEQQGLLGIILSNLDISKVDVADVITRLGPERILKVKEAVSGAVSKLVLSTSEQDLEGLKTMDEKARRRLENRERKKRWREINIERNRDNDLRMRVMKRAQTLYSSPSEEAIRQHWVASEFEKRKQKRLLREKQQREELLGVEDSGTSRSTKAISLPELLNDSNFLRKISSVYNALGGTVSEAQLTNLGLNKVPSITSIATALLASYVANTRKFDDANVCVISNSVVSSLNTFIDDQHSLHSLSGKPHKITSPSGSASHLEDSLNSPMLSRINTSASSSMSTTPLSTPTSTTRPLSASQASPDLLSSAPQSLSLNTASMPAVGRAVNSAIATFKRDSSGTPLNTPRNGTKNGTKNGSKNLKSRSLKDIPVDYKKFLSPHPPPASFWSQTKSNPSEKRKVKEDDEDEADGIHSSPAKKQHPDISSTALESASVEVSVAKVEHEEVTSLLGESSGGRDSPSPSGSVSTPIPLVRLPHYMKPEPKKSSSAISSAVPGVEPSIKETAHQVTSAKSSNGTLTRPGYYGLRKPGAFRRPQGFTKDSNISGIRKPFYGIVPLKRE